MIGRFLAKRGDRSASHLLEVDDTTSKLEDVRSRGVRVPKALRDGGAEESSFAFRIGECQTG